MIYPVGEQLAEDLKQGGGELSQGDVHVDITTEEPKKRKAHRGKSYSPATSVKKIKTECHEPQGLGDTLLDRLERKVYPALVEDLRVKQEELDSSLARETELHSKLAATAAGVQRHGRRAVGGDGVQHLSRTTSSVCVQPLRPLLLLP